MPPTSNSSQIQNSTPPENPTQLHWHCDKSFALDMACHWHNRSVIAVSVPQLDGLVVVTGVLATPSCPPLEPATLYLALSYIVSASKLRWQPSTFAGGFGSSATACIIHEPQKLPKKTLKVQMKVDTLEAGKAGKAKGSGRQEKTYGKPSQTLCLANMWN